MQTDPASSSSTSSPGTLVYYACSSTAVDSTTGACSQPVWVPQPSFFPSLSATDGGLIAFAIIAVWATAYMSRAFRTAGG